ncbi:hypothetical protein CYMTET_30568 [Cymbomonas tetramitiformis]|uniref:NSL complex protein NSL2 n=1 Tax=Cymbomonas tetramitiformis TaxID=36881 RepID=A0AAE0FIT0_9CHLO|nr:hypothetical protein CYMTET_30568 [Cymbomonas tetramitiformis]
MAQMEGLMDSGTETSCESGEESPPRNENPSAGNSPERNLESCNGKCERSALSRLEVAQRRKGRISKLLGIYKAQYWRLLDRLQVKHQRFYLRRARAGWKQAEVVEREVIEGVSAACEEPTCGGSALPLANFCFRHIVLQPSQCLYVANEKGLPVKKNSDLRCEGVENYALSSEEEKNSAQHAEKDGSP